MTREELELIMDQEVDKIVEDLKTTSYPDLPKWSDLEKDYDPLQHSIMDSTLYPPKEDENGQDDFKRTPLDLQKLAVKRVAQSMFATPVGRVYSYDRSNETESGSVDLLEEVYRVSNKIDSENISRAKKLNAACQVATIWGLVEEPYQVQQETSANKLVHKTYSPKDGYELYPITDDYDNLLVFSVGYTDIDNVEYLDTYISKEDGTAEFIRFVDIDGWDVPEGFPKDLVIFPVVYSNIEAPVWGGDSGTLLVEAMEELEAYQGLYTKRNALPTFTIDYGEKPGVRSTAKEKSSDGKRVIRVGRNGKMADVTWKGAGEAVDSRYMRLRNSYFEHIQVPDTSFANMVQHPLSAENRELVFADAKQNAIDLGGEWTDLFHQELKIVKKLVGVMFTKYNTFFEGLPVRSVVKPYSIRTKVETAEYVATAGRYMSLETAITELDLVDDVSEEADAIREEQGAETNNL